MEGTLILATCGNTEELGNGVGEIYGEGVVPVISTGGAVREIGVCEGIQVPPPTGCPQPLGYRVGGRLVDMDKPSRNQV